MLVISNKIASFLKSQKKRMNQSGQIAVVVFLIMAVLLVVGLSLATRTSQEIEQAGQAEDTTRVFNAAESGIEKVLDETTFVYDTEVDPGTIDPINNASVDLSVQSIDDPFPIVEPGQSFTVFTNTSGGTVDIRWGSGTTCNTNASIIVTKYIKNGNVYTAEHDAFNPNISPSCRNNQFQGSQAGGSADVNGVSTAFTSRVTVTIPDNTQFIRIKPLYTSAQFKVTGSPIDTQAHIIRSQATDTIGGNAEVRTIEVTRTRPAPPTILDYALYSGGTLEKD